MTKASLKGLLSVTAAAIVATVALAPGAQATCWWSGGDWNCITPPPAGAVIAPPNGPTMPGTASNQPYFIPAPSWGFQRSDYRQVWDNANAQQNAAKSAQQ